MTVWLSKRNILVAIESSDSERSIIGDYLQGFTAQMPVLLLKRNILVAIES